MCTLPILESSADGQPQPIFFDVYISHLQKSKGARGRGECEKLSRIIRILRAVQVPSPASEDTRAALCNPSERLCLFFFTVHSPGVA